MILSAIPLAYELCLEIQGPTLCRPSDNICTETEVIAQQHVTEDFSFLPTLQECLHNHPLHTGGGSTVHAQEEVVAGLVRRLGGQPTDYQGIASWFYRPRVLLDNLSFFRLLGNNFGIFLAEQRFGISVKRPSDGKELPTRIIAETLVQLALECIPTLAHFFKGMAVEPWMSRGARPLSAEFAWTVASGVSLQISNT